jgi:hypothetical protein
MKKLILFAVLMIVPGLIVQAGHQTQATEKQHFYNVDREIRFEGTVQEISLEPRYKDRAPFLIVLVLDEKLQETFSVEVSPAWFFGEDLHKGEKVKIVGSLAGEGEEMKTVIARQMSLRGETVMLRDKKGFPSWSGGAAGQKRRRRIGGF